MLNVILIYKNYGSSAQSDTYFLGFTIYATLSLIYQLFSEQFIFTYRGIISEKEKNQFLFTYLSFATIAGLLLTTVIFFTKPLLLNIFAFGLTDARKEMVFGVLSIFTISLVCYLPLQILLAVLNAIDQLAVSYTLTFLPTSFVTMALLFDSGVGGINEMAYAHLIGSCLALLLSFLFTIKIIDFKSLTINKKFIDTVLIGLKVRFAHNVHNFFLGWAITNYLSMYSAGQASLFFYAKKISDAALSVSYGPTHKLLINKIVDSLKHHSIGNIEDLLRKITYIFPAFFLLLYIAVCIVAPEFFIIIGKPLDNKNTLFAILFFLFCANSLISIEVGYAIISQANNKYWNVVIANLGFVMLFTICAYSIQNISGVIGLSISMFIGQLSNYFVNKSYANKTIAEMKRNFCS
ncbi:hypothetical protein D3878_10995 [Noviherbaspirillum sedimenti]|uniref:Polysaccharide biosynthesis protein C-terminal domain-containing protein n=2 Tax=Noviherbaspirillum sedimenti TaxID=2320865 RepID=A0A3A3G285_9BURK|nr:hypothetical protein D3878_10995 [Noviherbaspirillum sedimenti]